MNTKPRVRPIFKPDCEARVMGETIPAMFLGRMKNGLMGYAWIQTAEGVFSVNVRDLYMVA
jgi:hypothetical protein